MSIASIFKQSIKEAQAPKSFEDRKIEEMTSRVKIDKTVARVYLERNEWIVYDAVKAYKLETKGI